MSLGCILGYTGQGSDLNSVCPKIAITTKNEAGKVCWKHRFL
jgi:hypothetical protein